MKNRLNSSTLKRDLGLFSASILVVANMVGTGIFTTSGFVIQELGSPEAMILCWFVGGIFALSGALCYGELGAAYPNAGGEYVFLRESFGECMGFLSGWISLVVGFSAPIAASGVAFAAYFYRALSIPAAPGWSLSLFGADLITLSPTTLLASAAIIVLSCVHYHSLSLGSIVQNTLTLFKVGLIVLFIGAGLIYGSGSMSHFSGKLDMGLVLGDRFAVSLIFISFAYSGWNAAVYLGGEIKDPGRNIPLALFIGTLVVMCLYLALNVVYVYSTPPGEMSGLIEVGAKSAASLFGGRIAGCFTGAIALGLLSVLSAMIMAGPRVYYAMSRDRIFFQPFAKVSKLHNTPGYSITLQAAIAIAMVLTASFEKLLIYIGFTLCVFALLTVAGMVLLRLKGALRTSGYKTFGYPATPLVFIFGNLWIIYFSIKSRPVTSLFGLLTIAAGLVVYLFFAVRRRRSDEV